MNSIKNKKHMVSITISIIIAFICGIIFFLNSQQIVDAPMNYSSIPSFHPQAAFQINNTETEMQFDTCSEINYINSNAVIVRAEPNDESPIIFNLDYSDFVTVIGDNNNGNYGWVKIEISGQMGYIKQEYLSDKMLFFDTDPSIFYLEQSLVDNNGNVFPINSPVSQIGINDFYSLILYEGEKYIVPLEQLSAEKAEEFNYDESFIPERYKPVIEKAYSLIGVQYGHDCSSELTDCVGFTLMCYKTIGVNLPWSLDQANYGDPISENNIQPGDLIIWAPLGSNRCSHVGIYIGNGQMIHSSSTKGVTIADIENYKKYGGNLVGIRRI